jgi:hypothetical protein
VACAPLLWFLLPFCGFCSPFVAFVKHLLSFPFCCFRETFANFAGTMSTATTARTEERSSSAGSARTNCLFFSFRLAFICFYFVFFCFRFPFLALVKLVLLSQAR